MDADIERQQASIPLDELFGREGIRRHVYAELSIALFDIARAAATTIEQRTAIEMLANYAQLINNGQFTDDAAAMRDYFIDNLPNETAAIQAADL